MAHYHFYVWPMEVFRAQFAAYKEALMITAGTYLDSIRDPLRHMILDMLHPPSIGAPNKVLIWFFQGRFFGHIGGYLEPERDYEPFPGFREMYGPDPPFALPFGSIHITTPAEFQRRKDRWWNIHRLGDRVVFTNVRNHP